MKYLLLVLLLSTLDQCNMNNELNVQYFGGWSGYSIPFKPTEPISKEEAIKRTSYYIGYYNGKKLVKFEKFLNNTLEFTDEYEYWENTDVLKKRVMKKSDNSTTIQNFDKKGEVIKE